MGIWCIVSASAVDVPEVSALSDMLSAWGPGRESSNPEAAEALDGPWTMDLPITDPM